MAFLPTSGPLSINDINALFGRGNNLNAYKGTVYATVSGSGTFPTGAISISNFYGTSPRVPLSYNYSTDTANASINVSLISGYAAGASDITITVNSGVYLYATSTSLAGLVIFGATTGDTITLVNNGYIMGQGGWGGYVGNSDINGGPALSVGFNVTINNTNASAYIGGGGGGGGAADSSPPTGFFGMGGGGAGGGNAGDPSTGYISYGGAVGQVGSSGSAAAGAGGRIFPGIGGPSNTGGGAGGGGAVDTKGGSAGGGGSANGGGGDGSGPGLNGGGGGGWGASGGNASTGNAITVSPGSGGKAVQLNGYSVSWVSGDTSRIYGAVA